MSRILAALLALSLTPLLSGCLVVKTVDVAAGAAGAAVGAAGAVAGGAIDVVTPDGDDDERDKDNDTKSAPASITADSAHDPA